METKNLGLVKALFRQTTAPTRVDVLWYDTINEVLRYYDSTIFSWKAVALADAFGIVTFADPIICDALLSKNFKCESATDDTIINLVNAVDGDAGMIEIIIDSTGGYDIALGSMFTKCLGGVLITTPNADNFISWVKNGVDIVYVINTI